jgi:hypothetical protein
LIDGITAGWMAVQTLRRRYPDVFIHFHRAGHGAFTRKENPIGFSVLVLSKFARLAGASGVHTGTAGVGKMAGSPKEDVTAAHNILNLVAQGHFFSQSWSKIPENDKDAIRLAHEDSVHHVILQEDGWRGVKKCCPIISGGLNPTLLKPFIEVMGNTDFITTMGAGVHAHPQGTKIGARALVQACEAYTKKISIQEYAKTHKELAEAIKFFSKKSGSEKLVELDSMAGLMNTISLFRYHLLDTSAIGLEERDNSEETLARVKYVLESISSSGGVYTLPEVLEELYALRTVFNEGKKKLKRGQRMLKRQPSDYFGGASSLAHKSAEVERKSHAIARLLTGLKKRVIRFGDNPFYGPLEEIVFNLGDILNLPQVSPNRKAGKFAATALYLTAYQPQGVSIISGDKSFASFLRDIVNIFEDEQFSPLNIPLIDGLRSKGILVYYKTPYQDDYSLYFDSRGHKPTTLCNLPPETRRLIHDYLSRNRQILSA